MPIVNVVPPSVIKVEVNKQNDEKINSLSYGQARKLIGASDLNVGSNPETNQVIAYDASTGGFKLISIAFISVSIDEGLF